MDCPAGRALRLALSVAAAFIAFRFFDILKPGPVRLAERFPGGYGVMADDVVAGARWRRLLLLAVQWGLN